MDSVIHLLNDWGLTQLDAFYENSRNAKRVLRKFARETHASIERLGSKSNGDGLYDHTDHVCTKLDLK